MNVTNMININSSIILPLIAAAISAGGQVLLKFAMIKHGAIVLTSRGIVSLIMEPWLIFAMAIYATALFLWLQVLSNTPLSTAYPILAVTYILVPFFATLFFGEIITKNHFIGMSFILVGVAMIGKA
jgi:undecaprenyl phosphate-alpha-L-ara4N flippase subunit ArnE